MDGIKLEVWKTSFEKEVKNLQIQFDSFFKTKKLDEYFKLHLDDNTEVLRLEIADDSLAKEVQEHLERLLIETMPEDSV